MLLDSLNQQVVIVETLTAADDLAVSLGSKDVDAQRTIGLRRIRLHVEGFHRCRVMRHAHRSIELFGEDGLVGSTQVAADLKGDTLVVKDLGRVVVVEPREWRFHVFEFRRVTLEDPELRPAFVQHSLDHRRYQRFGQLDDVVEISVGHLGLDHPELGQMASGLALFSTKRRTEAVNLAESHGVGFVVKLPALRQVGGVVLEILHREQRRRALARRRRKNRCVRQDEAAAVEEVADGVDHLVAHSQDSGLPLAANPKVTAIKEVIDPVLLGRDRKVMSLADDL